MKYIYATLIFITVFAFFIGSALMLHFLGQGAIVYGESLQNHMFGGLFFGIVFGSAGGGLWLTLEE